MTSTIRLIDKVCREKEGIGKNRAFQRWRLKSNYWFLKQHVEKIAINHKINGQVAIWRMRKMKNIEVLNKNYKFLNNFNYFKNKLDKLHKNNDYKNLMFGFSKLKMNFMYQMRDESFQTKLKVNDIFQKHFQKVSYKAFNSILNNNPYKTLSEKLIENQKMKLRRVINSLLFFNRRHNLRITFNFVEIFIKNNRKKFNIIRKLLKSPYEVLAIKLISSYHLKKRFFYRLIYRKGKLFTNLDGLLNILIQNCNKVGDKLAIQNTFQQIQKRAVEQRQNHKFKKPFKILQKHIEQRPKKLGIEQLKFLDQNKQGNDEILFEKIKRIVKVNEAINKQNFLYRVANQDTRNKMNCNRLQGLDKLIYGKKLQNQQYFLDTINQKKQKLQKIISELLKSQQHKKYNVLQQLHNKLGNQKKKQYYLKNITKQLIEKHQQKVQQCYYKIKDPKWEKKQKQNAFKKLNDLVLKVQNNNKKNGLKRLSYYSEAYMNRAFYIIKNLLMKKNFETQQENFYLLRACKDPNFVQYLKNPKYLLQLVKMMKLKEKNQKVFHSVLVEPCYFMLKKNAGLLKPHELKHLENLMYLLKKKNRFHFQQDDIFQNKSSQEQNPSFQNLRNMFIEMIKQKVELIDKLKEENDNIKKDNQEAKDQIEKIEKNLTSLQNLFQQNQKQNEDLVEQNQQLLNQQKKQEQYSLQNEIEQLKKKIASLNNELRNVEQLKEENLNNDKQNQQENIKNKIQDSLLQIENIGKQNKELLQKGQRKKLLESELMSLIKSQAANKNQLSKLSNFKNLINQNKSLLSELEIEEDKVNKEIQKIDLQIQQDPHESNLDDLQESRVQLQSNLKQILSKKEFCQNKIQEEDDYDDESQILINNDDIQKKQKLIEDELNQLEDDDIKIYLKSNNEEISKLQNTISDNQYKLRLIEDTFDDNKDQQLDKKKQELQNVIKFNEDLLQKLLNQLNDINESLQSQQISILNQKKGSKYDAQIQSNGEQLENLKSKLELNDQKIYNNKQQIKNEKEDIKNALRQFEQFKILYSQRNLPIPPVNIVKEQSPVTNIFQQQSFTPKYQLELKQQQNQITQLQKEKKKYNFVSIFKILNKQKIRYYYKLKDLINIKTEFQQINDPNTLKCTQMNSILNQILNKNIQKSFNNIKQKSNEVKIRRQMASQFDRKSNQLQALHMIREQQLENKNKKNQAIGIFTRILDHHITKAYQMGFTYIKSEVNQQTKNKNQKTIFKLFNIASKFEDKKLRDYFFQWHQRRNKNLWYDKILKNLIQKTQVNSQIALWRMNINQAEKRYIDPHKWVGLIKLKNFIKRKTDENLILSWWAIEKKYQEMYTTNFITNFETQMYQSIQDNLNQIYFTAISEKDQFGESKGPSLIQAKKDTIDSKQDNLNPFYPQSSKGSVNAMNKTKIGLRVLNQFFKRKNLNYLFDTLKIFNNSEYAQSQYRKSTKYSQPSYIAQQQKQMIQFLLEQIQLNTSILKTQKVTIKNLEIDLKSTKDDEHYIKNHYHWVFLRRIQYILDRIDKSNKDTLQETFKKIKKL